MSVEKRIEYLLGAALRADHEGDGRTASTLRRMAEEARELEAKRPERRPPVREIRVAPTLAGCQ